MADIDADVQSLEKAVKRLQTAVEQTTQDAVERIEKAVERSARSINESIKEYSWVTIARTLYWTVIVIAVLLLPSFAWHSKWRYALQYGVDVRKVNIDPEPHDCEFLTSPLGDKHCHFERSVSTLRWATSTDGQPIASFDGGKTWSTFTPEDGITVPKSTTVEEVNVSWNKKDD